MSYASILAAQRQNYMNISLIGWSHLRSPIVKNIRQPWHINSKHCQSPISATQSNSLPPYNSPFFIPPPRGNLMPFPSRGPRPTCSSTSGVGNLSTWCLASSRFCMGPTYHFWGSIPLVKEIEKQHDACQFFCIFRDFSRSWSYSRFVFSIKFKQKKF